MRSSIISVFCLLLVLLTFSASGIKYYSGQKNNDVSNNGQAAQKSAPANPPRIRRTARGGELAHHLAYIRDTAGNVASNTKAKKLLEMRMARGVRYN